MTSDRLDIFVQDWTEILWGVVPEQHLRYMFVEAYRLHKPGSFFEAANIVAEWKKKRAEGVDPAATTQKRCSLCLAYDEAQKYPVPPDIPPCPFHQATQQEVLAI